MKLALCFLIAVAFVATCYCDDAAWETYKEDHHLHYDDEEVEEKQKANFMNALKVIEDSKAKSHTRAGKSENSLKLNGLAHLSAEDKKKGLFGLLPPVKDKTRRLKDTVAGKPIDDYGPRRYATFSAPADRSPAPSVDLMAKGLVQTPDYKQDPCGSCWAFTGIAVLEAHYLQKRGKKVKLSEQFVRDCAYDRKYYPGREQRISCNGAFLYTVFQLASEAAIATNQDYPYIFDDQQRSCPAKSGVSINVTDIARVEGDEQMMAALRSVGPLAVSMDANEIANSNEWFYWDGLKPSVYVPRQCSTVVNHAVTLVGYGTDPVTKVNYWLIRNSWGPTWANKGTFKIKRGTCGISYGLYPCIDGKC